MASEGKSSNVVYVLGAGYSGLSAAAEIALSGKKVHVVANNLGFMPPITIVGSQSRRWPGTSGCTATFTADDLNDLEIATLERFMAISNVANSGVSVIPGLKVSRKEGVWWNNRTFEGERLAKNRRTTNSMKLICTPQKVDPAVKEALKEAGYNSVDETPMLCVETKVYFDYLLSIIKQHGGMISLGVSLTKETVENMKGLAVINCLGPNSRETGGAEGKHFNVSGEILIFKDCPKPVPFYVIDDDNSLGLMQMTNGSLYISGAGQPKMCGVDADCTKKTVQDADLLCKALFGQTMDPENICEIWVGNRPAMEGGFNVNCSKRADGQLVGNLNAVSGAGAACSWGNAQALHEKMRAMLA